MIIFMFYNIIKVYYKIYVLNRKSVSNYIKNTDTTGIEPVTLM